MQNKLLDAGLETKAKYLKLKFRKYWKNSKTRNIKDLLKGVNLLRKGC